MSFCSKKLKRLSYNLKKSIVLIFKNKITNKLNVYIGKKSKRLMYKYTIIKYAKYFI